MQVLFLEDVAPHHRAGDVKEVKNGYGRNYLIPKKLATLATAGALQQATALRAAAEERRLKEASDWQVVAEELEKRPVVIKMRAGPTGRLYGSVTNLMIAAELSNMTDRTVERRGIRIPEPIRQVGSVRLPIKVFEDVGCEIEVQVVAETDGTEEIVAEEPVSIADALEAEDLSDRDAAAPEPAAADEADEAAQGNSEETE